ncbi:thimanine synthesis protein ThiJ [Halostagnicola larsenii XH-48]|uniref:Thimanine synthesis protein ThiJ n=1 Tax=Halostagnicola larsenii XH-48 TaxID=797299 RepID=W0JPD8_9EURY|nr:DJ-1/PfpI family protein [Halostagnicola larsenii]AHG00591.1 thimanine synthesis protein ThiJ [Halostagnicola larsenii XH-48]
MTPITAEILLFEGFDELDAVGPYEVFDYGREAGAPLETSFVTLEPTDLVRASHGMRVEPDGTLGDPDLLVVPGGGWASEDGGVRRAISETRLPAAVADAHARSATVASVCTGAMILADAGILEGRPATTHHTALEDLAEYTETVDQRVVDDGDILTAGGVTSGIDLALWLLEREFDADVADSAAEVLEHERQGTVHR